MRSANTLMLIIAAVFLAIFLQFGIIGTVFERLDLTQESGQFVLLATLVGSMINMPLFSVKAESSARQAQSDLYRLFGLPLPKATTRTVVAVNVGGAVTPVMLSIYLLLHNPLDVPSVAGVTLIVTLAAYLVSVPLPGIGISMPILVAPLAAALAALLFDPTNVAPLAYIGGTWGVLIGADLLRIRQIGQLRAPVASIGGAGVFDGIFLTGLFAVLLA